jgi:hypothetical protein
MSGMTHIRLEGPLFNQARSPAFEERLQLAGMLAGERLIGATAKLTPVNLGILRQSLNYPTGEPILTTEKAPTGELLRATVTVGYAAGYAPFVEEGRKPGKPPPARAIEAWVRRKLPDLIASDGALFGRLFRTTKRGVVAIRNKGVVAEREAKIRSLTYAIQKAIAKKGTQPRHMLKKAFEQERAWVLQNFEKALKKFVAHLGGA